MPPERGAVPSARAANHSFSASAEVLRRVTREVRDVVRGNLLEDTEIASQDWDVVAGSLDEGKPEALTAWMP